jgi:hypothetical protein
LANTFQFVGNPTIPKGNDRNGNSRFSTTFNKEGGDWITKRINFLIKPSKNDGQFVSLVGAKPKKESAYPILTYDNSYTQMTVQWKDRFDEDTIGKVAYNRQYSTNVGGETQTFIHAYDFIEYLTEHLDASQRLNVTGTVNFRPYQGKISEEYQIQKVWLAKEEDKNGTYINLDLYYNEGSIDKSRIDEKIIDIRAYVSQYIDKTVKTKYVPIALVFDGSKIDFAKEKQKKIWDSRIEYLTAGKIFVNLAWRIKVFSGAEEVEFNELMLSDAQKEEIELGLATIDDFRPAGNMFGKNKTEFKLVSPNLRYKYKDGAIDTKMDFDDFSKNIFMISTEVSMTDMTTDDVLSSDDEDLFS